MDIIIDVNIILRIFLQDNQEMVDSALDFIKNNTVDEKLNKLLNKNE